ncbi:hypothetical protein [Streptomyces antimicrobicus]|uniref:Integral membrane protein n=1 Tax=Streptomyces antimicrobicus TaxID=2883108 RepID=A0ABS8B3B2_9ACTN|nr:hypothetical protein [Streptomyces antimicrobicus]MCB5179076.1 hypothetical protein [Streptomyces antimicrobicus]
MEARAHAPAAPDTAGDAHSQELKKELDATLQARRELGPEYEAALVDSFVDKVDTQLRRRLAEQRLTAVRAARAPRPPGGAVAGFGERYGFAVLTLVLAVPLSAIGAAQAGLSGLLVSWGGILGVNFVHAHRSWRRSGEHDQD